MKPDVLVDTSIWIEYFNRDKSVIADSLERLLEENKVVVTGIIITELLQGTKNKNEFDAILENITALPLLESRINTWIEAGRISFNLRRIGLTIPTTDILIASIAIENNCQIFTMDPHFEKIPEVNKYTSSPI